MQPDQQAIQGLWRIVSYVARGQSVFSTASHYQFDGNRVKAIDPSRVDGGHWSTFELDPSSLPKRFTKTSDFVRKGKEPIRRVDCWLYEIEGDTLRLCWPNLFGDYPDVLSDETHGVITLARDPGPPPPTKRPSGKQPVEDPLLGLLSWNDDLDWWEGQVALRSGQMIDLHLSLGDDKGDDTAVAAGRKFVLWLRENEPAARRFAAAKLLDVHNDSWNEGEPIAASAFAGRIRLESASIYSGGAAELYYEDDDLFWGHCIIVSVSEAREFEDARIAG